MRPRPTSQAGFTLVEVLIAVAIMAALTSLMWVSISNMFATRDVIEQRSERYHLVRVTMNRITKEVAAAYVAGPEFGAEELPGEDSFAMMSEEERAGELMQGTTDPVQLGMIGKSDSLHFTTLAHVRTMERERASDHAEIGYFLRSERGDDGRLVKKLMRREDVTADDNLERGGVIYTMLPEVESIKFEYWDAGAVKIGTFEEIAEGRWVNEWNTTRREHAGRLPTRVRVTIELPPVNSWSQPEKFTVQSEVMVTEVLEF